MHIFRSTLTRHSSRTPPSCESRRPIKTHTHNIDSAFSRFFNEAELIAELASLLYRSNISRLMQASRTFCRIFEPFLYRQLELSMAWQSHLVSAASFQALTRNTHHVLHWDTSVYETAYVYNGLIAYQEQSEHFVSFSAPGQPGSRSSWLSPRTTCTPTSHLYHQ